MSREHKHCLCGGCYGYHYPSCNGRKDDVDYDTNEEALLKQVAELDNTIDAQSKEIEKYEKTCLDYVDSLASREARIAELEAENDTLTADSCISDIAYRELQRKLTKANAVIQVLANALAEGRHMWVHEPHELIEWAEQQAKEQP